MTSCLSGIHRGLRMPVMDGFDATRAIKKMGIELAFCQV